MEMPILSICIPTFNRAEYLRICLESISVSSHLANYEVVVSDNASTDQTMCIIEDFQRRIPIRWMRQVENVGADRNFNDVVNFANGKYCWLLGSDDVIEEGALEGILGLLHNNEIDILQFGYIQATLNLEKLRSEVPPVRMVNGKNESLEGYFCELSNLSLMQTFISAFVFRRSAWIERQDVVFAWLGSNYVQTAVMHSILASGGSLLSVEECFVVARGDNPNQFNTFPGIFLELDSNTVSRLISEIHYNKKEFWAAIGKCFKRSYPSKALINISAQGGFFHVRRSKIILKKLGYPKTVFAFLEFANKANLFPLLRSLILLNKKVKELLGKGGKRK